MIGDLRVGAGHAPLRNRIGKKIDETNDKTLNKPANENRANAARLPLWMYVLAWLVRTTRLGEYNLNVYPIHESGATATGDDSPVKERTPLELYTQVIAAYERAGFWPLFKQTYLESGNKWLAKGWFFTMINGFLLVLPVSVMIITYFIIPNSLNFVIVLLFIIVSSIFYHITFSTFYGNLNKKIRGVFKEDIEKYGSLVEIYTEGREFTRYLLFRSRLKEYKFDLKDVEIVKPLLTTDQQTLGSYVAQRAVTVWIASTLTAVLAASATTWSFLFVGLFSFLGLSILLILRSFPVFPGRQRRQYELHRWLAWYEAEAPQPMAVTPDRADRLLN